MPRKGEKLSDELKAKMAAGRAKAKQPTTQPKQVQVDEDVLRKLLAEVEQLKANQKVPVTPEAALQTTAQMVGVPLTPGGVQGIQYRYSVDKNYYPDPTERLANEPSLSRFAMGDNFIFKWDVEGVIYEKYNITYSEPRFIVELWRRLFDDDGQDTGKKAFINRVYMQEDELVARIAADKLGLSATFESNEDMMNEMRYQRIKDWLMSIFNPPKIVSRGESTITTVIDGKVVEISDNEEFTSASGGQAQAETIRRQTAL